MPGLASHSPDPAPVAGPSNSFNTLKRENAFRYPSTESSEYPAPQLLVAPHIDSFNALFEGAPYGSKGEISDDHGLLDLAIADLNSKVIFDGKGPDNSLGNRLESTSPCSCSTTEYRSLTFRLSQDRQRSSRAAHGAGEVGGVARTEDLPYRGASCFAPGLWR